MAKSPTPLENFSAVGTAAPSSALSVEAMSLMRPAASPSGSADLPQSLTFTNDIYPGQNAQSIESALAGTDPSKINFTTPASDAASKTQPDYYMNSKGQLFANPDAPPHKDGAPVNIELEGNKSATQAKQYADQLQKQSIQALWQMMLASNPNAKMPEMWSSILNSQPSLPSTGDSVPNPTSTQTDNQPTQPSQPTDSTPPPATTQDTSATQMPSSDSSPGGGSPGGGGDSGIGGNNGGGGSPVSDSPVLSNPGPAATFSNDYNGPADSQAINDNALKDAQAGASLWQQWDGGASGGVEGCAASVSVVLQQAGYPMEKLGSALVDTLVNNLKTEANFTQDNNLANAKPGDIIWGDNGGQDQHIGVVVEQNGKLYCADNDSYPKDGKPPHMILEPLNSSYIVTHFGQNAHLLHPPPGSH